MSRLPKRRPNPQMTAIIVGVVTTQLVTVLSWLSQYSGGPIRVWQIPALLADTYLAGLIISQSGAALKKGYETILGLPKNSQIWLLAGTCMCPASGLHLAGCHHHASQSANIQSLIVGRGLKAAPISLMVSI